MDILDIKRKRTELEGKIADLLYEFERQTYVKVTSITYSSNNLNYEDNKSITFNNVNIKIEI